MWMVEDNNARLLTKTKLKRGLFFYTAQAGKTIAPQHKPTEERVQGSEVGYHYTADLLGAVETQSLGLAFLPQPLHQKVPQYAGDTQVLVDFLSPLINPSKEGDRPERFNSGNLIILFFVWNYVQKKINSNLYDYLTNRDMTWSTNLL